MQKNFTSPRLTPKQKAVLDFILSYQDDNGYAPSQNEIAHHFGYKSLGTVQNYLVRLQRQGVLEKAWNSRRGIQVKSLGDETFADTTHTHYNEDFNEVMDITEEKTSSSSSDLSSLRRDMEFGNVSKLTPPVSSLTAIAPAVMQAQAVALPLVGMVAAGRPIEAITHSDQSSEQVDVPVGLFKDPRMADTAQDNHFVLKVKGDSMIEDGIFEGDLVVIRKQAQAQNGQTVVALINNEATIKRFQKHSDRIELHPANPNYDPLVIESLTDSPTPDFNIEGIMVGLIRKVEC